ncbi:reverse transcriptase family protein [Pendulispora rubella]|uniref:RNA-directed DNA polymerase n=1 Tax=Pendulispora rubella TaxID=2741070 RepID=A0ABZ2LEQ0_9BACT
MANDDEKAKLFRRIAGANVHLVVERMRVHGFWPQGEGLPPDPKEEVDERGRIDREIAELAAKGLAGGPHATDKALHEERMRRWEESKKRRALKKKQREVAAAERRAAWGETKRKNLVHAGEGVSAGLQDTRSDEEKLRALSLPVLHTANDLVAAIGITLSRLRFLTYHRAGTALVHYHRYGIPKKSGGIRSISAPKRDLKDAQDWIHTRLLAAPSVEAEAHGFVPERSIVTNARTHVGKRVVINLDLVDFFPTITYRRTKGLFSSFGYSEQVATCLALLCTEPPRVPVMLDGARCYVAIGARVLPQGAPTSPSITNLVCRKLDRRLRGLAQRHGFQYTRYADDLTFSGDNGAAVGRLLRSVRSILTDEGFVEHPKKTRIMRRGRRQEVTAIVVNDRMGVARDELRKLRAILHNAGKHGLMSQNRENHPNFAAYLRGRVAFVRMVDPSKGPMLSAALERALARANQE